MSKISDRQKEILSQLEEFGFISVSELSKKLFSSPSSIRRDLTHLENIHLIRRTHGGAEMISDLREAIPLDVRLTKNTTAKRLIAKKASVFLKEGQTIMLDGSTTAAFLLPHIASFKNVTVYTNSMLTAGSSISYGIRTHCIGGCSVNGSAVLSGEEAYRTVNRLSPDILFFSSQSIDSRGDISDSTEEENYLRSLMLERTSETVFLCDSEKFNKSSLHKLVNISDVDAAVFDSPFDELRGKCKKIIL